VQNCEGGACDYLAMGDTSGRNRSVIGPALMSRRTRTKDAVQVTASGDERARERSHAFSMFGGARSELSTQHPAEAAGRSPRRGIGRRGRAGGG